MDTFTFQVSKKTVDSVQNVLFLTTTPFTSIYFNRFYSTSALTKSCVVTLVRLAGGFFKSAFMFSYNCHCHWQQEVRQYDGDMSPHIVAHLHWSKSRMATSQIRKTGSCPVIALNFFMVRDWLQVVERATPSSSGWPQDNGLTAVASHRHRLIKACR